MGSPLKKKQANCVAVCVLSMWCAWSFAAETPVQIMAHIWGDLPRPQLCLAPCDQPPTIDGQLNDDAWAVASVMTNFIRVGGGSNQKIAGLDAADAASEILVTYDATHLYVAARMSEPEMNYLVSKAQNHDDKAWEDDCLEWFLETKEQGSPILQLVVTCAGVVWDGRHTDNKTDVGWTCEGLRVATGRGVDEWYLEMAIPYEGLGMSAPTAGQTWRTSFCRERYATLRGGPQISDSRLRWTVF